MAKTHEMKTIFGFQAYPPFQLDKSRFPQDRFLGRWLHFLDVIDPRTLLVPKKELEASVSLLQRFKDGQVNLKSVTDEELWKAQKIKQSTIHPDTGEKVFMPFRMAGFVPFGSISVIGLLLPNQTLMSSVFWQWLNQSHNACVNYANRNASQHTPTSKFVIGYIGAVSTAISIATALTLLIRKAQKLPATTRMFIQRFVPLPAVCLASTFNVLLMRWHELGDGIALLDEQGKQVAISKIAAKKALGEMALTRAFLPIPIFLFPPIIMTQLERGSLFKRFPRLHLPINAVVCTLVFGVALPISIAMFPQLSHIKVGDLETDIQKTRTETVLYYNKGL